MDLVLLLNTWVQLITEVQELKQLIKGIAKKLGVKPLVGITSSIRWRTIVPQPKRKSKRGHLTSTTSSS